ncbi:MAG: UDP-glucose/GDP-mannose dehydrogenase family protein [Candidatus Aenigmarchaeota archaeon]|nr:UDP-glucose/GDP-mannose dehydrogenase family protein [Candidatus Aenigmarchaeota archaeon]
MFSISIIGSGYVGSSLGKGLQKAGNNVIFHDINKDTIKRIVDEGHNATLDIGKAIKETDISFLCVPTPTKNGKIDLSYIQSATESIGKELGNKTTYHLVVVKSTVVPTTTEKFIKSILEKTSGKICGQDFGLCVNPEFLTQVNKTTEDPELKAWYDANPGAIKTFEEKAVIGEYDKKSGDILEEIFKQLDIMIFRTDLKTAELIKYAHNLNLANRISYWNEIFLICNEFGIDSKKVAEIVSTDTRIGKYGTVHGKAFGGTCLPKDLAAFLNFIEEHNIDTKVLKAVHEINEHMSKKHGVRE